MSKIRKFKIYDHTVKEEIIIGFDESEIKTKKACEANENYGHSDCTVADCYALKNKHSDFFEDMRKVLALEDFLKENNINCGYELSGYVEDSEYDENIDIIEVKEYMKLHEYHPTIIYAEYKGYDLILEDKRYDIVVEEVY